jgi:hypothetical protein
MYDLGVEGALEDAVARPAAVDDGAQGAPSGPIGSIK